LIAQMQLKGSPKAPLSVQWLLAAF